MSFKFISQFKDHNWFCLTLILLVSFLMMLPILVLGIPSGTDLTQHLQFASTYQHSILSGDFFPGWAASDNQGFGSIGIRFYPPIAYYLLGLSQIVINDWYYTFWLNSFWWMFIGCLGMYLWAKEFLSPSLASLAAIFYAFIPYHLFQIFQASLFAEFAASSVLPFCFLTATKLVNRGKTIDVLLFSISCAILILTHIPTTIIGILALTVFIIFLTNRNNRKTTLIKLFIAFSLGLAASAFHWLKVLTELDWVKHSSQNYSSESFSYKIYLFPTAYSMGTFVPHFDLPIILTIILLLPLSVYWFFNLKSENTQHTIIQALLGAGFFCVFMLSVPSILVWEYLPFLQKIQFPWRWLSAASVIGVFAFVFAVPKLLRAYPQTQKLFTYFLLFLFTSITIYNLTQNILPMAPLNKNVFAEEIKDLQTRRGCECWQTMWAQNTAFNRSEKVFTENRSLTIIEWGSEFRKFKVGSGTKQIIRLATFYYPYWNAEINGQPIKIEKDADGSILIPIGDEESEIVLTFQEPLMLQLGLAISLLTWLILLSSIIFTKYKTQNKNIE